jgi:hypothetical protein
VIEDVIAETGATTDEKKKGIAMHYCEPVVKNQWKALVSVDYPYIWAQFEEEIREIYPEYKELEKGLIVALEKFVVRAMKKPIKLDDYKGLQACNRQFKAMVKQLTESTERRANCEVCKYYLPACPNS